MSLPGELDLHLIGEGRHERLWEQLGAHALDGDEGVRFSVWAPSARGVSVVGDWNHWSEDADPLAPQGSSGVWAGLAPNAREGHAYKLAVRGLRRRHPAQGRSDRVPGRGATEHRLARLPLAPSLDGRGLARAARGNRPAHGAAVDLRGPRRLVASGPRLA